MSDVIADADDVVFEMMVDGAVGWYAGYPQRLAHGSGRALRLVHQRKVARSAYADEQLVAVFRWDSRTEFVQAITLSMDICGNSYGGPVRPPRTR